MSSVCYHFTIEQLNNKIKYRNLLVILLFSLLAFASGQVSTNNSYKEIDSLKKLLATAGIREQVDILNQLAKICAPVKFDSSIYYSAQAMRMATINEYSYGIGCSRLYAGNAYYYKMDFKNALVSYLSAQTILEESSHYDELGELCLMLGHINFFIRMGEKSFSYYRKALEYYRSAGDHASQVKAFEAMSLAMDNLGYEPLDSTLSMHKNYWIIQGRLKIITWNPLLTL